MENRKETPAQIAERALRNFKDDTPIPVLLDAVNKALYEAACNNEPQGTWKPELDETYYSILPCVCDELIFEVVKCSWGNFTLDERRLKKGWVLRTKPEAQSLCDKLNDAIKDITL